MAIYDLYSKRQKRLQCDIFDVYLYEEIPQALRVQIIYIITDALGSLQSQETYRNYEFIWRTLCREYGQFRLIPRLFDPETNPFEDIKNFLLEEKDVLRFLDAVELSFRIIDKFYRNERTAYVTSSRITPDEAIKELNTRFREHRVGYQFESSQIIRVDSQFIHSKAVVPTLRLLSDKCFEGANDEFLKAHEHYRHGKYKECLRDCLNAFESTMKIICNKQGWFYQPSDTAKNLINVCLKEGLIPKSLQAQLESGIPTLRNKFAGHGQGSEVQDVPQHLASYQLHLTATTILFLVEAEKALPPKQSKK